MVTRKNDEAVSPVIGVILMVAITVILAAVIAAFVFGMSGNISKTKIVAVTGQQPDGNTITVTYQGGQDAGSFISGNVTVTMDAATFEDGGTTTACTVTDIAYDPTDRLLTSDVGSSVTATTNHRCFAGKDHVVATGLFGDGTSQVLLDTYI
jgi:archaeal type IV pilus assembly protein PilA